MLDFILESLRKLVDGLAQAFSGALGLAFVALGILVVVSVIRWFFQEPKKAIRITLALLVMFGSLFVLPIASVVTG